MAFKKKETTEKEVFQVTFPLLPNQSNKNYLDRYFEASLMTEHHLMSRAKKRLAQMERTKAWKDNQKAIEDLIAKRKGVDSKTKKPVLSKKDYKKQKDILYDKKKELIKQYGLDKESIEADAKFVNVYGGLVHSAIKQKISYRVSKCFNDYFWGKGKDIKFTSWKEFYSIEAKSNATGIRLVDGLLKIGDREIKVGFNKKDKYGYETQALSRKIHYCGIKRR